MLKVVYPLLLIATARSEVYIVFRKDGRSYYTAASTLLAPEAARRSTKAADTCHDYACAGPPGMENACCATEPKFVKAESARTLTCVSAIFHHRRTLRIHPRRRRRGGYGRLPAPAPPPPLPRPPWGTKSPSPRRRLRRPSAIRISAASTTTASTETTNSRLQTASSTRGARYSMQPCHHESQPAPSSTPTHNVLLVRASQARPLHQARGSILGSATMPFGRILAPRRIVRRVSTAFWTISASRPLTAAARFTT